MHSWQQGAAQIGTFDLGGTAVSFAAASRHWAALARERYGGFETSEPAAWSAVYRVTDPGLPSPASLRRARGETLRGQRDGGRLDLATESFRIEVDFSRRTVALAGPLATYPVDGLIQALWYETRKRGLIFHGAALAEGGRGWLASGPSGSGKSTLAALLPERALCDELAGVDLGGGEPRLRALPFWVSRRGNAALAGIYLLRHGESDRRRRLGSGEAFTRLRREVAWPTFDRQTLESAFATLCELVGTVPIWELSFRPRREVWNVIQRETAA